MHKYAVYVLYDVLMCNLLVLFVSSHVAADRICNNKPTEYVCTPYKSSYSLPNLYPYISLCVAVESCRGGASGEWICVLRCLI